MTARTLYRLVSIAEAVTWTLLIAGMILKYVTRTTDALVSVGGALHGFAFLLFVVSTVVTAINARWRAGQWALGLGSAVIPWATLAFDAWAERRGLLPEHWRLRPGGDEPTGPAERLLAWVLAHPLLAAILTLVAVSLVFSTLLWLGPPTGWGERFS
ncbi:MAG: DUF3817 domain-containing protein [Dermabacter sp.]|nr:DUF3817 domain-containing protein [Dermabacter sp.]